MKFPWGGATQPRRPRDALLVFTIGHIVAPGLFTIILGFGKSQYIGNTTTGAEAPAGKSENE